MAEHILGVALVLGVILLVAYGIRSMRALSVKRPSSYTEGLKPVAFDSENMARLALFWNQRATREARYNMLCEVQRRAGVVFTKEDIDTPLTQLSPELRQALYCLNWENRS